MDSYRYGYQGSEKDDEAKGSGNSYTTFFRQLDPRVGRWFSIDPVFQPFQSPYCSMDGNPILKNDPLGDYSKDKAEKMAKRGAKKGYETNVTQSDGGGKNDFGVSYFKRNETNNGSYMMTQFKGRFKGIGKKGLVMDNEIMKGFIDESNNANTYLSNGSFVLQEGTTAYVAGQFKSSNNLMAFQSLRQTQQDWRINNKLGKLTPAFKMVKGVGMASTIVSPIITSAIMYDKAHDGDPNTNVTFRDGADLTVGTVGLIGAGATYFCLITNPVGWGIGFAVGVYGVTVYTWDEINNLEKSVKKIKDQQFIDSPIQINKPKSIIGNG